MVYGQGAPMAQSDSSLQPVGGRLSRRLRPWQRLRGSRAFQRPRGLGVYRHSDAALIRILPSWEAALAGVRREPDTSGRGSCKTECLQHLQSEAAAPPVAASPVTALPIAARPPTVTAHPAPDPLRPVLDGFYAYEYTARSSTWRSVPGRRLGVVASRKVGNAVVRNRAKRVFREIFRQNQSALPAQCDVLVIIRKGFMDASRQALEAQFADVVRRAVRSWGR